MKNTPEPQVNTRLLTLMRQIYREYTGQEVAAVVAQVRRELTAQQEEQELDNEIERLVAKQQQRRAIKQD